MNPPSDEAYLLAALRMAAGTDPVPPGVAADARAAYALRLPGGVTAVPLPRATGRPGARSGARREPPARPPGGAGERGAPPGRPRAGENEPRLVSFAGGGLAIDVEITVCDGHLDVAGQVRPALPAGSRIEIRTPRLSEVRFPAGSGEFAATGLPHGWLSVACHRPGQATVATRWLCVRP
ncbi:hypothetical protein Sru01_48240 [Sphaerisporangium rufum]|uniref:Uncharacterized protein n=1 Tax=Sphaerisporangium rufum TaxID=1381558 RepID=A0A919V2M4_9ACTN|nr:hypothetical protein [Sphaerisporangium rufum]GII79842.1 hypothetical protein Sru01_48240 [Sphaerisporangium rufum]